MEYRFPQVLKRLLSFHPVYRRKITYAELAKAVGVHPSGVARYARGETAPTAPQLLKMAEYLQVSTDQLLMGRPPYRATLEEETLQVLQDVQDSASAILDRTEALIEKLEGQT